MAIEGEIEVQKSGDPEFDALFDIDNVDTEAIAKQINPGKKAAAEIKPEDIKPEDKKPDDVKPEDKKPDVPDPDTIKTDILNEIFGDQYKTVEEAKKANISASLQELVTLRQKTQELETQLAKKPKHAFASDDIAKFNEFARDTGIKDVNVFNKLNAADVANMDDVDALALQHIIENPRLASRSPQEVRKYIEMKYKVDPAKIDPKRVESGDLTQEELDQNKQDYDYSRMELEADADKAKAKLVDFKGKIKMPETQEETLVTETKWTPEVEKTQKTAWTAVNEKMSEEFSKIPIVLKGGKEPIINFVLPEEAKKAIMGNALDFVVSNQMEVNQENVTSVAQSMFSDILFTNREEIYHAIFERARSMTEEEVLKHYHNPSPKNNDNAPTGGVGNKEEEEANAAYNLEMKQ